MSKTQSIASAFGAIAKTLATKTAKYGGTKVEIGAKTRRSATVVASSTGKIVRTPKTGTAKVIAHEVKHSRNVRAAALATPDDGVKAQRLVNREMRKFARGLKAMGVRRLRFLPYANIDGAAAFRAAGKPEDRVAELTNLYTAEGALKSVKSHDDATIIRLNYSRTARVEVMNKGVVFYA
jgi:hypothetical protein